MKKDDGPEIYAVMKDAVDAGLGYGIDEFPTYAAFQIMMLVHHTCVVFEDEKNGKVEHLQQWINIDLATYLALGSFT